MIRLFTALCKSLFENLTDAAIFYNATDGFSHYGEKCPSCGAFGKLSPYGGYSRNLVSHKDGMTTESRVSPCRLKCTSCGVTHALLPDIVIPYSQYSLRFKLAALIAYFERNTTVADAKPTVRAVCECFGIAVSTLYSWKERLLEHKELLLGMLASKEEPAITFIQNLFGAPCLSGRLRSFFRRHTFSFMQRTPAPTTRSQPP
jgi:transposase-like protein